MKVDKCPACKGKGVIVTWTKDDKGRDVRTTETCNACNGDGYIETPDETEKA